LIARILVNIEEWVLSCQSRFRNDTATNSFNKLSL